MCHVGVVAARALAVVGLGIAAPAHGSPTTLTAEGGVEADSNIERVEDESRRQGVVGRLGARFEHRGKLLRGGYAVGASALSRVVGECVVPSRHLTERICQENVALLTADLRWLRPVGERKVHAGFAVTGVDAVPLTTFGNGARTFRYLGADAVVVLRKSDERELAVAAGGRSFEYKPNHDLDWTGPAVNARLDLTLWEQSGGTRSVELAATFGFEARAYEGLARASACPPDAPPNTDCNARTPIQRRDRYQRAGIQVTWIGRVVAAAGYHVSIIDSNSYQQSVILHRATLSATTALPKKLVGTALATLQIDQFPDGMLIITDTQHQELTNLEDANRSSLQFRLARALSATWSLEGRAALWSGLGGADKDYRRGLLYLGVIYNR